MFVLMYDQRNNAISGALCSYKGVYEGLGLGLTRRFHAVKFPQRNSNRSLQFDAVICVLCSEEALTTEPSVMQMAVRTIKSALT